MTELIQEPQFKVDVCICNYYAKKRYRPSVAIITEKSYSYLEKLLEVNNGKLLLLKNSWGQSIKVYRIEEISPKKREKIKTIKGIPFYLCQTGIFGRIKTESIRNYDLEETVFNLSKL